ncbi:MAG: hypothetical protein JWO03_1291 [Bacteroidetes bacterium]|nr:hypothetical protein [Bacteroidota bacterium]
MDPSQICDMITTNREYIKLKSNIALQNLAMLHRSFDHVEDDACILGLMLNDSMAALIFSADYAGSIAISQRAIDRFQDTREKYLIANHESVLGRCYTFTLKYAEGRDYLLMAEANALGLELTDEVRALLGDILHDLAMNNHHAGGDTEESISYLDRALAVLEPTSMRTRKGVCLMGKGNVRFNGQRIEEALVFYKEAEAFFEGTESMSNLSAILCNIGMSYTNLGRLDEAEPYLMRALELRIRLGSYWEIANSYYNISDYYRARNEIDRAYDQMLQARDYALVSQTRGLKLLILGELETMALAMGNADAAAEHHKQYLELDH